MGALTRRNLLRNAAAGTVVAGWDAATRSWATAASRSRRLDPLPRFDGLLLTDPVARRLAADDYGHIVKRYPRAVLRPLSARDVVELVRFAAERGISVTMRGQGHSSYGQAQVEDGVVIDSSSLARIHRIAPDRAVVDPGVVWRTLLVAAAAKGLTPPVLTDVQTLSVGGTLSLGGFDAGPMPYGAQVDNVLELDVVTGDGRLVTCSPTRHRNLFDAVRGGLGQCGVIVRATVRLVRAPAGVLLVRLRWNDLRANLEDIAMLVRDGRFDSFEELASWENGRWVYDFQGAVFLEGAAVPPVAELLRGLRDVPARRVVTPVPYLAWPFRLEALAIANSPSRFVMFNGFLPERTAPDYLAEVFSRTNEELGADRHLFVPGSTKATTTPLVRLPAGDVFLALALLRKARDATEVTRQLAENRWLYDRLVDAGGTRYPWDAVPDFSRQDWIAHFGPQWRTLLRAKRRYDPAGILGSGVGIF